MEKKVAIAKRLATLPPLAVLDPPVLDLSAVDSIECRLTLSNSVLDEEHYLVMDVYSYANHVHPEGHVGWWKVKLDDRLTVPVVVIKNPDGVSVKFPGAAEDQETWVNPEAIPTRNDDLLIVHVVLRACTNDAIRFDDLVPLYMKGDRLQSALQEQRKLLDDLQGLDGAAYPGFVWPDGVRVHIVTETFSGNDAIGNFVLDVYKLLNRSLVPCSIYAASLDPTLKPAVAHVSRLVENVSPQDVVFVNFSIHDKYLAVIADISCRRICYFHNITPPHFFRIYNAELAADCERAYDQLTAFLGFDKLIANSKTSAGDLERFVLQGLGLDASPREWQLPPKKEQSDPEKFSRISHHELIALKDSILRRVGLDMADLTHLSEELSDSLRQHVGNKLGLGKWVQTLACQGLGRGGDFSVSICPPTINPTRWDKIGAEEMDLPDFRTTILYVGRIAPHKKIEDLIALLDEYQKLDEDSCLLVVGASELGGYYSFLQYLLLSTYKSLKDRVFFLKDLTPERLKAVYQSSSVYVSMSEHEGFGLPILEAMGMGKPVFAYALPAIQETLGDCGKLFWSKDMVSLAAEIYRLLHNSQELSYTTEAQRRRFEKVAARANGSAIWTALQEVLFNDARTV